MDMDKKFYKVLIALIVLIVANISIFLLVTEFTASFWCSYLFAMLAIVFASYINIFYTYREKIIFGYPISLISLIYLVTELLIAILFIAVSSTNTKLVFLSQLIIFAVFCILFLQVLIFNKNIKEEQKIRGQDIADFKRILEEFQAVQRLIPYTASYRKTVTNAYDALASGQVKSFKEAKGIEAIIHRKIVELRQVVTNNAEEEILKISKEIEELAEERKQMLIQHKNNF